VVPAQAAGQQGRGTRSSGRHHPPQARLDSIRLVRHSVSLRTSGASYNGLHSGRCPSRRQPCRCTGRAEPRMEIAAFSSLGLAWPRLAAEAPPEGFHEAALTLLEPHLAFDSAWWGVANAQAAQVSVMQGYLHRLPPEFIEDWWSIADVDALARRCAA